jgi:hypothetical protein
MFVLKTRVAAKAALGETVSRDWPVHQITPPGKSGLT